jgi:arginase
MDLSPIAVPYHLGRPEVGAARGPDRILQALDSRRLDLPRTRVAPSALFANEVAATMNVDADLAEQVRRELASGRTPVAISADCISCLGTLGGLMAGLDDQAARIGVVWLDAHGDFNTAASSPTGYLDGMALAAAVGREWGTVAASVPGFRPVDPANVIHLGGRDFDQGEAVRLEEADVVLLRPSELKTVTAKMDRAFGSLAGRVDAVYLHLDLDVLDLSVGIANAYSAAGGPSAEELMAVLRSCLAKLPIRAVALTAYDPDFDPAGTVAEVAAGLIEVLAAAPA